MARGVARMPVFQNDQDRELLLREVELLIRAGTLIVHSFCLMLNHIHLLCETPVGCLSRWMRQILGNYAERYNRTHDRVGHLWQGRYKAILVQDGSYLLDCSRYIHLNPYRAGVEHEVGSYPWSSYSNYVHGQGVAPWVCSERILSHLDGPNEYRSFVESGLNIRLVNPFKLATAGIVLGSDEYVSQIRELVRRKAVNPDVPSQRALLCADPVPSIENIQTQVEGLFADWSPCQRRRALVWALYANTWMKGREIAQVVSLTPKAVSNAARETEWRRTIDPAFARRLAILQRELQRPEGGNIARIARSLPESGASGRNWQLWQIE